MTYKEFISNILETRGRFACGEEYHERHHIMPKCIGGSNDESNLIDLFGREHFEAHRLLAEENPKNKNIQYAWWSMAHCGGRDCQERYVPTPEEYESARRAHSENMSGTKNPNYGRKHTEEAKKKISDARKANPKAYWKGKRLPESTKRKISQNNKGKKARGKNPNAKKIMAGGVIYDSARDCADGIGVKYDTMLHWFSNNSIPKKYEYLDIHYVDKVEQTSQ